MLNEYFNVQGGSLTGHLKIWLSPGLKLDTPNFSKCENSFFANGLTLRKIGGIKFYILALGVSSFNP